MIHPGSLPFLHFIYKVNSRHMIAPKVRLLRTRYVLKQSSKFSSGRRFTSFTRFIMRSTLKCGWKFEHCRLARAAFDFPILFNLRFLNFNQLFRQLSHSFSLKNRVPKFIFLEILVKFCNLFSCILSFLLTYFEWKIVCEFDFVQAWIVLYFKNCSRSNSQPHATKKCLFGICLRKDYLARRYNYVVASIFLKKEQILLHWTELYFNFICIFQSLWVQCIEIERLSKKV